MKKEEIEKVIELLCDKKAKLKKHKESIIADFTNNFDIEELGKVDSYAKAYDLCEIGINFINNRLDMCQRELAEVKGIESYT